MNFQIGDLVDLKFKMMTLDDGLQARELILRYNLDVVGNVQSFFTMSIEETQPKLMMISGFGLPGDLPEIKWRSIELLVFMPNNSIEKWDTSQEFIQPKNW